MQIKQAELQRKVQKDQTDAQLRMAQQQIEKSRIQSQTVLDAAKTQANLQAEEMRAKMELGVDLVKEISQKGLKDKHHKENLMADGLKNQLDVKIQREMQEKSKKKGE